MEENKRVEMNDCIMLFIDQKKRDTMPVMFVYFYLKKMGFKVILCSALDLFPKYIFYKPKVVMQANPDTYHSLWTRFMSEHSIVTCLPTETASTNAKFVVDRIIKGHNPTNQF